MSDIKERLRRVCFIVCDVDGVLTEGGIAFDGEGRPFRTFCVRDVTALTLWHLSGGKSALITGLGSKAVEAVASQWKCTECHMWVKDKRRVCQTIAERHGVGLDEMAFLGDDIIDVRAMRAVGLAVAPHDAAPDAKAAADVVAEAAGGKGCLRELVYRILAAQGRLDETIAAYCAREDGPQ
ncbi:MAG: HAD hydrolase family protein [Candidatus Hydrogenedentes bacterium]|nr:HAD hydrolase family protein [Candidatus Hydrogenedentota bacterium]